MRIVWLSSTGLPPPGIFKVVFLSFDRPLFFNSIADANVHFCRLARSIRLSALWLGVRQRLENC